MAPTCPPAWQCTAAPHSLWTAPATGPAASPPPWSPHQTQGAGGSPESPPFSPCCSCPCCTCPRWARIRSFLSLGPDSSSCCRVADTQQWPIHSSGGGGSMAAWRRRPTRPALCRTQGRRASMRFWGPAQRQICTVQRASPLVILEQHRLGTLLSGVRRCRRPACAMSQCLGRSF